MQLRACSHSLFMPPMPPRDSVRPSNLFFWVSETGHVRYRMVNAVQIMLREYLIAIIDTMRETSKTSMQPEYDMQASRRRLGVGGTSASPNGNSEI
jgi:hypothetical protein